MRRRYALVCTYDERVVRRFWRLAAAQRAFHAAVAAPANPLLFDIRKVR